MSLKSSDLLTGELWQIFHYSSSIAAFLAAIARHDLAEAEMILAQLRTLTAQEPAGAPWAEYAQGILANERDYDWAEAERIFTNLLLTGT
ncbi:MAG: hypothetical protein U0401_31155 [Anaerolineae bacterium]